MKKLSPMAADCLEVITKKLAKEMTGEEYYIALMELERKYPDNGFGEGAQKFAKNWLSKKKERLPYKDEP